MRTWKKNPKRTLSVVSAPKTPENIARHDWIVRRLGELSTSINEAAALLAEEHESRLYLLTHKNWESFVRDVFGCSRKWADELVAARDGQRALVNLDKNLDAASKLLPKLTSTKAHAVVGRILRKGGNWRKVVEKAVHDNPGRVITEAELTEVANSLAKADKKQADLAAADAASPLPAKIRRAMSARDALLDYIRQIRALLKRLEDYQKSEYGRRYAGHGQATDQIRQALDAFKWSAPYADCPKCIGMTCTLCQGDMWLTRTQYDGLPDERKALSLIRPAEKQETEDDDVP